MTTTTALVHSADIKTALEAYRAPAAVLIAIMRDNPAPAFSDIVGWEFNGTNVGVVPGLIGVRKFRKGFYNGPARRESGPTPFIQGYNIPIKQNGVGNVHIGKPSDEAPKRFGFYRVYTAEKNPRFNRYPQSLLLDYGLGRNGLNPAGMLRDYLVQIHPGSSELLLGQAFLALGPITLPVGFFVLERTRQHTFAG